MPDQRTFQAPRGTRDFYPEEMAVRRHIEGAWRRASIDHGFEEVDGPTFEHLELYTVKSGEGIVNELFSFTRAGGESVYALRPEFTPTLARMIAARGTSLPVPVKWFAIPNFFRAERPQRGRLREFFQWNIDLVGLGGPATDAEVIAVAITALERLGLTSSDVVVRISHRRAVANLLRRLGVPEERQAGAFELLDRRDKIEPDVFAERAAALEITGDMLERFDRLARAEVPVSEGIQALAQQAEASLDDLDDLRDLGRALDAAGIAEWCVYDLGIVRGLAYYTGTVFEIHARTGAERAVAGGGRYDGLVQLFGGPPMPACGFGMGDVVLGLLLEERGLLGGEQGHASLLPRPDAFLISAGAEDAEALLPRLAGDLRRSGLHVRHSYRTTRNVGKLLGEASRTRARYAVILGNELSSGLVALKDLESGVQREVPVSEVATAVRSMTSAGAT